MCHVVFVVGDEYERCIGVEVFLQVFGDALFLGGVEELEGFVEQQEFFAGHEAADDEHELGLAGGEPAYRSIDEWTYVKMIECVLQGFGRRTFVLTADVFAGSEGNGSGIKIVDKLGAEVVDAALDLPDGFAAAAAFAEQIYLLAVGHGMVGKDEAEQGGFAGAVLAGEGPSLAAVDDPAQIFDDVFLSVAYGDASHLYDGVYRRVVYTVDGG